MDRWQYLILLGACVAITLPLEFGIGARVYLGPRSCVLYGAEVSDNARLGPLTLDMKGENIPAGSSWSGCPAAPAQD